MTHRNYLGRLVRIFFFIECLFILQQATILKLATYYPLLKGGRLAMDYSTLFSNACQFDCTYIHNKSTSHSKSKSHWNHQRKTTNEITIAKTRKCIHKWKEKQTLKQNKNQNKMEKIKRSWTIIFAYEIGSLCLITSIPYSPWTKASSIQNLYRSCWTKHSFQLVKLAINLSAISHNHLQPNVKIINQTPFVAFAQVYHIGTINVTHNY